jgi:hypothetical protein
MSDLRKDELKLKKFRKQIKFTKQLFRNLHADSLLTPLQSLIIKLTDAALYINLTSFSDPSNVAVKLFINSILITIIIFLY